MPKIKVSVNDYDECWIKTKKLVDSQIYTNYLES